MDPVVLTQRIASGRERLSLLAHRAAAPPGDQPEVLMEILQELLGSIEELQVAEEELCQQNEELALTRELVEVERQRYRYLFEFAPDGYLVTDAGGKIEEANRAAAVLLNMSQECLKGKLLVQFIPLEERGAFRDGLNRLMVEDQIQEWPLHILPRRRIPLDAAVKVAATRDTEGRPVTFHWLLRDTTERRRAEAKERRLEMALGSVLERKREMTAALLKCALGEMPTLPDLEVAVIYQPAAQMEHVGGDYFDFILLDRGRIGVVLGDVCGRGLPAAQYAVAAKYMLRAYAREDPEPGRVLRRLNQALSHEISEPWMFVTLVYAVLDMQTGSLTFASGGHPPPVLYDPALQGCRHLEAAGLILGAFPDQEYEQKTIPFAPGATLALYTDGVIEAGGHLNLQEEKCISTALEECAAADVECVAREILARGCGSVGSDLHDDVAIIVLRHAYH